MLDASDNLIETDLKKLKTIRDILLNKDVPNENIVHEQAVDQLTKQLDDRGEEVTLKSRTGKLWMKYLNMIRLLLLFIRADGTGDWNFHLFCILKTIQILHAGGHTAYAKSNRLYLQQMYYLNNLMDQEQYMRYASCGYWTIRRNHRFCQKVQQTRHAIEQVLMRMLKSRGGLAHGRGINPGTQAKLVYWFAIITSYLPST